MKRTSHVILALVLIASLTLAACQPAAPKVIKIATQSPLSGGQSVLGVDIKNGAELALEQLGGPLKDMGFTVTLAPYDDQANPDTGVANAKQIVADPAILCGVGHLNSGVMIPSSEEYHTAGLAFVSPANTNPLVTDRGYLEVSRLVGRDDLQGPVGAEFAATIGSSVYILHDKTAYGQGLAEFFQKRAQELGLTVAGFEGTEEKANFDAILTPILAANPDVVYFGGIYDQAGVFFKQAREKGYQGTFLGGDGLDSSELPNIAGDTLIQGGGTYYTSVAGPAGFYDGTAKFISDFKAKYGADPQPFAAQGYDAMAVCLQAIEAAAKAKNNQTPTRAEVANAVRAVSGYAGLTGTISFNSKGDLPKAKYFIIAVSSGDPAKWGENSAEQIIELAPPQ
jgi:branched-chain amino acid transport system substrate-binding protein